MSIEINKIKKAIGKKFLEIRGWKDWERYDEVIGHDEGDINIREELIDIAIAETIREITGMKEVNRN